MDYNENSFSDNQKKFSTSLIIVIVLAILIVAGAAWFAISRMDGKDNASDMLSSTAEDIMEDVSSVTSIIKEEYEDITSSYNNIVSDTESQMELTSDPVEETNKNVSSVPYEKTSFSKPCEGEILKAFSGEELLYSKTFGDMRIHNGIDIACKNGTSISACGNGRVLNTEESSHYGTVLTLELENGLTAKYSNLSDLKVKAGDSVKSGDILGVTATIPAECNDAEHLHFEIYKNGTAVDPFEALNLTD